MLGLWVNVHFCGGIAESVQVFEEADCCCEDEKGDMEDCCKDETVFFQFSNQLQHPLSIVKTFQVNVLSTQLISFPKLLLIDQEDLSIQTYNPKIPPREKIYLFYQSLTFYS